MEAQAKQQVVERLKQAADILVTVSKDPSVDQLAACIGTTLLLNKLGKHATAVFSGKVPSTIEFLQPEKTLEANTDSLQDFIISLDKAKADKLRYKIEDQFVKIYITPYKTSIGEKDLQFSQGDFNVDVVLALGVISQSQLDAAILAHGKILHDAAVISVNAGEGKAVELGQINWKEPTASSLSEMIVSISEAFGSSLLDSQMATAFLTGIVAETKRFSNLKTSPKVMTMSAQLMAAGANQQLIVSKLEPPAPRPAAPPPPAAPTAPPEKFDQKPEVKNDGTLNVNHGAGGQDGQEVDVDTSEIRIDTEGTLMKAKAAANQLSLPQPPKEDQLELKPEQSHEEPPPGSEEPAPRPEKPEPESKPTPEEPPAELAQEREAEDKTNTQEEEGTEEGPTEEPPGPHSFLDAGGTRNSFTAALDNDSPEADSDPLAENHSRDEGFLTHSKEVKPPEDDARGAVERAFGNPDMPAPPPFPPPMNLGGGVVIPPPQKNSDEPDKSDKKDDKGKK
ncbi:MAG TPA: hypothetical protein VFP35_01840 [Candidatus Saccharimonadales bacterium]|nr:hypothetical protein [Candidatus Saccharimonadales bacterium]